MASSVDGCYRRDKELLYTIGKNHTTTYIGRSVREDELCNSFNSLDEELSTSPIKKQRSAAEGKANYSIKKQRLREVSTAQFIFDCDW